MGPYQGLRVAACASTRNPGTRRGCDQSLALRSRRLSAEGYGSTLSLPAARVSAPGLLRTGALRVAATSRVRWRGGAVVGDEQGAAEAGEARGDPALVRADRLRTQQMARRLVQLVAQVHTAMCFLRNRRRAGHRASFETEKEIEIESE